METLWKILKLVLKNNQDFNSQRKNKIKIMIVDDFLYNFYGNRGRRIPNLLNMILFM